jgi:hypothetical protein
VPVAASVSGTLTRTAPGGSAAAGTLSVTGFDSGAAFGTLSVDRSLFLAFTSRVRECRPDVYIDGELMTGLVETVEIDETLDDPIAQATFTLSDKRVAFFDPESLSNGSHDVQIDLWVGPPGGVRKWTAFRGKTEAPTNSMPYRPRGAFRAVGNYSVYADFKGCLNVPAMSGLYRGDLIAAFCESAAVPLTGTVPGGGLVRKALSLADKAPVQLIQELGEIEGWFVRVVETPVPLGAGFGGISLEIVSEDRAVDGTPVFAFDESNSFDTPETTPNRPVNDWVLSCTRLIEPGVLVTVTETPGSLYGLDSKTVTEVTTDSGVEIKRVETTWATVVKPGVTTLPAALQITQRVTMEIEWEPYLGYAADGTRVDIPSLQMNSRTVTTEMLMGVPFYGLVSDPPGSGGAPYIWVQGGRFTKPYAELEIAETVEETFTWSTPPTFVPGVAPLPSQGMAPDLFCAQNSCVSIRSQLFSPLKPGGFPYVDGSVRKDTSYVFQEVSRDQTWGPFTRPDVPGFVPETLKFRWFLSSPGTEDYGIIGPNQGGISGGPDPSGARASLVAAISPIATLSAPPSRGSADLAQVVTETVTAELDAVLASGYPPSRQSPTMNEYAESIDELNTIAKRRIRRACSDVLDIPHRAIPFLRVGDHVTIANHARSLVDVDAFVTSIKRTFDVANGGAHQVTSVRIPADWI